MAGTHRGPTPTTGRSPGQGGKELRARVSAAEYAEVQARAAALGLTVSAYVLRRVLADG